jgi:hypothetical protein
MDIDWKEIPLWVWFIVGFVGALLWPSGKKEK